MVLQQCNFCDGIVFYDKVVFYGIVLYVGVVYYFMVVQFVLYFHDDVVVYHSWCNWCCNFVISGDGVIVFHGGVIYVAVFMVV